MYLPHQSHPLASFFMIPLIYTNCINPEHLTTRPLILCKGEERRIEVKRNSQVFAITYDTARPPGASLDEGESDVGWS
jgi:hypothetical protein